jgi:hypothetical protein
MQASQHYILKLDAVDMATIVATLAMVAATNAQATEQPLATLDAVQFQLRSQGLDATDVIKKQGTLFGTRGAKP